MRLADDDYTKIVNHLHEGLYLVDRDRVITYWNGAAERISGFSAAEVVGKACADNILTHVDADGNNLCTGLCPLAATIGDGAFREGEVFMHHKDGHRVPVSVRVCALTDDDGAVIGGIELFTDTGNRAVHEERIRELEKLALLDNLTQLANRNYLERELAERFGEFARYGAPFGLLFMDIDHFKRFNDTYGHDVGDEVLRFVANTFAANARPFDLYGRWGGEEFIGVVRNVDRDELAGIGERLRMLVEKSYLERDGRTLQVTLSAGATLAQPGDTVESLTRRADALLYRSKGAGRNRLTVG